MNCSYHPDRPAVTQCPKCQKGLCAECAGHNANTLCVDCRKEKRFTSIFTSVIFLIVYAVVFFLGYKWDFLFDSMSDHAFMSGYFLVALVAGWQLCNFLFRMPGVVMTLEELGVLTIIKVIVYWLIGLFLAPIVILWNVIKIIYQVIRFVLEK